MDFARATSRKPATLDLRTRGVSPESLNRIFLDAAAESENPAAGGGYRLNRFVAAEERPRK